VRDKAATRGRRANERWPVVLRQLLAQAQPQGREDKGEAMNKDEALDFALEALSTAHLVVEDDMLADEIHQAITAIKQARSAPVQEPAFYRHEDGHLMTPDRAKFLGLDLDDLQPLYTTPSAAPVQEPVAWMGTDIEGNPNKFRLNPFNGGVELYKKPQSVKVWDAEGYDALMQELELWKAAAQRQWVGLTEQERNDIEDYFEMIVGKPTFDGIEAKLKEKNT
jgi:hypothetical protein